MIELGRQRPPRSADPDVPSDVDLYEADDPSLTANSRALATNYWWSLALPVRFQYAKGMGGPDIAAFQLNLKEVTVDGDFGRQTHDRVVDYQTEEFGASDADGVAGPRTNQRLCVQRFRAASDKYRLPTGLLKSFASSESNFLCGAVAPHPNDGGWDVGGLQLSSGTASAPSQSFLEGAYDLSRAAEVTAQKARAQFEASPAPVNSRYLSDLADDDSAKFKWQMVALNHNWPAAAYWIPRRGHIYVDPSRDDEWTAWISDVTNGRLTTPRQWVNFQVQTKTVYLDL